MTLARLEITELVAGRPATTVVYFPTDVAPHLTRQLRPIVDAALAKIDLHDGDARLLLASELAKRWADGEAYGRECARRGVLAL